MEIKLAIQVYEAQKQVVLYLVLRTSRHILNKCLPYYTFVAQCACIELCCLSDIYTIDPLHI
jgi:hypothetical protein